MRGLGVDRIRGEYLVAFFGGGWTWMRFSVDWKWIHFLQGKC